MNTYRKPGGRVLWLTKVLSARKVASPHDRANWLSDVRTSLEKHGIGRTMWDYSGGFGIVTKENGQPQPDEIAVKALGRTMPQH